jgi:hypothetical protein
MKLSMILLMLLMSNTISAQDNTGIVIMRWSAVEKGRVNSGDPYFYVINENGEFYGFNMQRENLSEGKATTLIHKKLTEYYAKGYKLISSNFTATSMGYCEKGEYILQKE